MKPITHEAAQRLEGYFQERIKPRPSQCWEWTGTRDAQGYGVAHKQPFKWAKAHRLSYALFIDDVPDDMMILHSCDNPPCVNPAHLRAGTALENSMDMLERGRHACPKHERNGRAVLTASEVAEIRGLWDEAPWGTKGSLTEGLAERYGVTPRTIRSIGAREHWC